MFECRLTRGQQVLDAWGDCSSPADFNLKGSTPGDHTFAVRATDLAGNLGAAARSDYELLEPPEPDKPDKDEREKERPEPSGGGSAPTGGGTDAPAPAPVGTPSAPAASGPAPADGEGVSKRRSKPRYDGGAAGFRIGRPDREVAPLDFGRDREDSKSLAERLLDALGAAAAWTGENLDKTAFPLALLLLVLGYMGLQNRLDRRDPKLALAPVHADSTLEFLPPPSLRQEGGGHFKWVDQT